MERNIPAVMNALILIHRTYDKLLIPLDHNQRKSVSLDFRYNLLYYLTMDGDEYIMRDWKDIFVLCLLIPIWAIIYLALNQFLPHSDLLVAIAGGLALVPWILLGFKIAP